MTDNGISTRDFIYLDVDRVKSLLSQLERGLMTGSSISSESSRGGEAKAGIALPFLGEVGGAGRYLMTNQTTETVTLHDHVYTLMEDKLIELGRIRRIPEQWNASYLVDPSSREDLSPVEYFLADGRVLLQDYQYMQELIANFNLLLRSIHYLGGAALYQGKTGNARQDAFKKIDQVFRDQKLDETMKKEMEFFMSQQFKHSVILKILPDLNCPQLRLVGPLKKELLRESMDDIRYKYGATPEANWKVFGQIAAVPRPSGRSPLPTAPGLNAMGTAMETIFEGMRGLEDLLNVQYPEIAMTPIAVYRG